MSITAEDIAALNSALADGDKPRWRVFIREIEKREFPTTRIVNQKYIEATCDRLILKAFAAKVAAYPIAQKHGLKPSTALKLCEYGMSAAHRFDYKTAAQELLDVMTPEAVQARRNNFPI